MIGGTADGKAGKSEARMCEMLERAVVDRTAEVSRLDANDEPGPTMTCVS